MHRHDAARRQEEIEGAEHRFLDLARVGRVANENDLAGKVDRDDGFGAHPWRLGSALNDGRSMMVSSGTKVSSSGAVGRISNCRMKRECQAYSV